MVLLMALLLFTIVIFFYAPFVKVPRMSQTLPNSPTHGGG
jgi:hypothetical protein